MTNVKSQSGFTLLELLIVVAIVSIMAAAAASGFGSSLAEGKTVDLAEDLVRIGRAARTRPLVSGAHRLVYHRSPTNTLGVLRLDRGNTNLCNLVNQWSPVEAVNAIDYTKGDPSAPPPTGTLVIDFKPTNEALNTVQLCFEPSGIRLLRIAPEGNENPNPEDVPFVEAIPDGGGIYDVVFQVSRSIDGGEPHGVVRYVQFLVGGSERML